ncbi:DUF4173 domain-containing protein [Actinomadura sp. 7K507]|uniref:DUF4153 domain-containing protein n=1 Tax=Actinomadura sp. 7K507 TaxID=2530365 RepID=UPI0010432B86|nr:DUF4173 domain-containing protein [Actinomadura sp. 7K507]TDC86013.1 DUF4173 domain-containing protein [Actinomadura sp. 7K507]
MTTPPKDSPDPSEGPSTPPGRPDTPPSDKPPAEATAKAPEPAVTASGAGAEAAGHEAWQQPDRGMARTAGYGRLTYPPPPPVAYTPTKLDRAIAAWKRPSLPMSPSLAAGAAIAGVIGAVTVGSALRDGHLGVGLLIAAAAIAYVTGASAWSAGRLVRSRSAKGGSRFNRTGGVFLLLAVCLSATPAIRDADWIVVPALLLAVAAGSYAASGGRSWVEVLGGGLAVAPAAGYMLPWAARGAHRAASPQRGNAWPVIRTSLIVIALLVVFGGLFMGADAAFGDLAAGLAPEVSAASVFLYVLAGVATLLLACAAAFLAQAPPPLRLMNPDPAKPAGRWSWAVPIIALDLLFLLFCAIQARMFLADDKDELLRSTGLTYAEYARQGFFQLVVVTVLVLVVVAAAMRYAPSAGRADRVTVRVLLGLLCALTLVVVAVALRRLYLYEETFGWTRLRLWVHAFELWLGAVVVLVAVAGVVKGRVAWLPRMVAASGAVAMIALVSINPDGFIAEHNVQRFEETGKLDIDYLRDLSADAVPALDRLPEPQRSCALRGIAADLREDGPAMGANHARSRAREILNSRPVDRSASCFAMDGSS